MNLSIQYTGQLANVAGASGEALTLEDGAKLKELVENLAKKNGPKFEDLVMDESGKLRPSLMVIFDGVQADGDLETIGLEGVSRVMLMTPIAGG